MRSAWYKPQHHLHSNCAKITILKIQQILQNQILLTLSAHYKQPWWRNQLFSGNYFSRSEETSWTQGSCLPCFFHCNLYLAWRHTVLFPSSFFLSKIPFKRRSMWSNLYKSTTYWYSVKTRHFLIVPGQQVIKAYYTAYIWWSKHLPPGVHYSVIKLLNYNWHKWPTVTSEGR